MSSNRTKQSVQKGKSKLFVCIQQFEIPSKLSNSIKCPVLLPVINRVNVDVLGIDKVQLILIQLIK